MSISADFLTPKPIQEGADLANQWARFKEEFELFLTATEKGSSDDKVKVAIMLRCIGPRGNDIFKTFAFTGDESKDKYADVVEKFDSFCKLLILIHLKFEINFEFVSFNLQSNFSTVLQREGHFLIFLNVAG